MLARCKFNLTEKGRGRKGRERTLREVCFHFFCFFLFFNKRDTTKAFSWKKENVNKRGREGEGKKNPTLSSRLFEGSLIIKYTRIQESCSSLVRQRDVRWRTNNTFNVHSFVGNIFLLAAFLTSRFILLFAASFFFFSPRQIRRDARRISRFSPLVFIKKKKENEKKERKKRGEIKRERKKNLTASILSCIHYNNKWPPSSISIFLQGIFDHF